MTLTLPSHITAATGMDALTHATEAFTCMAKNPLSDAYATSAVKKISQSLLKVMDNPKDEDGRLELAQASTMAGIAFSNSMVDRKSTRLNSSHVRISYAVFCLKK